MRQQSFDIRLNKGRGRNLAMDKTVGRVSRSRYRRARECDFRASPVVASSELIAAKSALDAAAEGIGRAVAFAANSRSPRVV